MITKEVYLKALSIVEAYHNQVRLEVLEIKTIEEKPIEKYKNMYYVEVGDFVECIEVHGNSINNLTKGQKYEVQRTRLSYNERDKYIFIRVNSGKLKEYNVKNTQFKALK